LMINDNALEILKYYTLYLGTKVSVWNGIDIIERYEPAQCVQIT